MEYLLLIHADPKGLQALSPAEVKTTIAAYTAYTESLEKAGVARGSRRLRDSQASTTVRVRDGKTEVHHGPFIETREELGGYYMIDVPDLDVALSWAARCPGASHGVMEVRPIWPMNEY
ncbi:MAG TPA: YciI family protein [Burkholderiaceae bacterium]